MNLFGRDLDTDFAVIAECGVNHEGDLATAERMVALAAETGADAVKFQTYTPERFVAADDPARVERVRRFDLGTAGFERLAEVARECGIAFLSTAVTEDAVPLIARLSEAIKIASGDVDFRPVIDAALETGRTVILSTGTGTMDEIATSLGWAREAVGADALRDRLVLMHCVSAYPTPLEQANVLSMPSLRDEFGLRVGYSNHVSGNSACLAAVALGACLVEAHFTESREGKTFRDHHLSFEPAELRDTITAMREIHAALGRPGKIRQACESDIVGAVRKGVVAARDLAAGTVLSDDDMMYARPATEFAWSERPSLIGRTLTVDVGQGRLIPRAGVSGED